MSRQIGCQRPALQLNFITSEVAHSLASQRLCGFSASSRLALDVCKSTVPNMQRSERKGRRSLEMGSLDRRRAAEATRDAAGERGRAGKPQTFKTGLRYARCRPTKQDRAACFLAKRQTGHS